MKKYKNLKPIDFDINLIYRCPVCNAEHWLSMKEASIDNFKTVCDCDTVFKVKKVKNIEIKYYEDELIAPEKKIPQKISEELLNKCTNVLKEYGFTEEESIDLVESTYLSNPVNDAGELIKLCFSKFGEIKNDK